MRARQVKRTRRRIELRIEAMLIEAACRDQRGHSNTPACLMYFCKRMLNVARNSTSCTSVSSLRSPMRVFVVDLRDSSRAHRAVSGHQPYTASRGLDHAEVHTIIANALGMRPNDEAMMLSSALRSTFFCRSTPRASGVFEWPVVSARCALFRIASMAEFDATPSTFT